MPPQNARNWHVISPSRFPWEQEALDFVHERFPAQDNYRAWSNFEFIADDGSINEVDLLVACPQGVFLIEIKSDPGELSGDSRDWTWTFEGHRKNDDNPVFLTNLKCKRLKSLLGHQRPFRNAPVPYIEPLVFVSDASAVCRLTGTAEHYVRLRDTAHRPGIMGAIRHRECPGLRQFEHQVIDRPRIKAVAQALEQAGIRPSQKSRRVGDFLLEELLVDSPLGVYQDWRAIHATVASTRRVARIYLVSRQATPRDRELVRHAALREFELLERLDHPGVLKADPPTECVYGPVLFFRQPPGATRLDQFLVREGATLPVHERIDILRQIGETIAYAHGRKIVHRSLSPQSILITREAGKRPLAQISNWQTGLRLPSAEASSSSPAGSASLHAGQLIEDASHVFIAPEALSGNAGGGTELDCFSLGALAYLLFTGQPPAASVTALQQKLSESVSGGLDVREALDGAVETLVEIVRNTANGTASDRASVEDFLAALALIEEELTRPVPSPAINPLEARKSDVLEGGYEVESRLGSGSVSVVLQVALKGKKQVLKVARAAHYNQRLRDEFQTLQDIQEKVRSRIVVAPFELLRFGDLQAFTMESAGEKTMARHLREEGPLDLTYLQRFGDDLIRTIRDLDDAGGIAHRDLKPENMGLRSLGRKQYQLCLFDFSLSKASPEEIKVGTLAYMDPFIGERKVRRWDISSECFSAAMTLHEMATGVLPTWGDGKSDPASVKGEVHLQPERFDPDLRDRFAAFFQRALARDFRARFDNPSEMLKAWAEIFATIDERKTPLSTQPEPDEDDAATAYQLPEQVAPATQLVLLGLNTRLLNALDRLGLVTVADLLGYPLRRIYKLPNVGNLTRRRLGHLVKLLRERLPQAGLEPAQPIEPAPALGEEPSEAFASVDLIASQVAIVGRGQERAAEQRVLQAFLGWPAPGVAEPFAWLSQSDLAGQLQVSRQRVGQVIAEGRERWRRFPSITALRETIGEVLRARGGVVTHEELVASVLAARGSAHEEPRRTLMASVATRAATETERGQEEPRFLEHRTGRHVFVALSSDLRNYAVSLGQAADRLAAQDPIPSPASVLEALRAVPAPSLPEGVDAPTEQRLCQLAVAASSSAALSSRMEIYAIGLPAERALMVAQNALFGGTLTVAEMRGRVAARLPRAQPLPERPELDRLIESLGLDLRWNAAAAHGQGAFEMPSTEELSLHSSETLSSRYVTRPGPAPVAAAVPPEIAEARAIEAKLTYAARNGAYLALSVPHGFDRQARAELARRFPVEMLDLDAAFLGTMRAQAEAARADWNTVLRADAAPPDSADWKNLQLLVERCLPTLVKELRSPDRTRVVVHPGLLARYGHLHLLGDLASSVGRTDGIHGLWLLLPDHDGNGRPVLNGQAVPLTNPAQHVRLNQAWLANKHRG